jgi:hypothetical protein
MGESLGRVIGMETEKRGNADSDENIDDQEEQDLANKDSLNEDRFESESSWPEVAGSDNSDWEHYKRNSRVQPTPSTMIDAVILELQAIEAVKRRTELEIEEAK